MPTITMPEKMTIKLPHGAGHMVVNLTAFDGDTWLAIVNNGLKQKIGDSMSDKEKTLAINGVLPIGTALHDAVRDFATKLIDRIVAEGWKIRQGGGGAKLSDPIDVWVRDEAERGARYQIARGTAFIDGRKVAKALPADVKVLRDRLMADPGWVALARAAYRPPIEAPTEATTILAEPGLEAAKAA